MTARERAHEAMKIGDRVQLSERGRQLTHLFPDPSLEGVVVKPGISRGGMYVRIKPDGDKAKTFTTEFWRKQAEKP